MKQVNTISKTIPAILLVLLAIFVFSTKSCAQLKEASEESKYNFPGAVRGPSLGLIDDTLFFWLSNTKGMWVAYNYGARTDPSPAGKEAPVTTPSRYGVVTVGMPNGPVQPLNIFNEKYSDYLHGSPIQVDFLGELPNDGSRPEVKSKEIRYMPPVGELSPDGKWFLFWQRDQKKWVAANMNGLKIFTWPSGKDSSDPNLVIWTPDSRTWLELDMTLNEKYQLWETKRVFVHSLDEPQKSKEIKLKDPTRGYPLAFTKRNNLITFEPFSDLMHDDILSYFIIHLDGTDEDFKPRTDRSEGPSVLNFAITVPKVDGMVTYVQESAMSTEDEHILLLTGSYPEKNGRKPVRPFQSYDLWLTDPYQRSMTKIGHMERKVPTYKTIEEARAHPPISMFQGQPTHWRWLPDNKRVSYFLDGTLYVLQVVK